MAICPYCKAELILPDNAEANLESYSGHCKTITECCGNVVYATISYSYNAVKCDATEDDWGNNETASK